MKKLKQDQYDPRVLVSMFIHELDEIIGTGTKYAVYQAEMSRKRMERLLKRLP